ncbi:NAD(P)/FAD-dependent oxidoreductase [Pseudomonas sp.]|uniref:NAD(P)/FAD-dependent oxidoreductase n=1 Tax=Pseudomonas sp. TaxID=306 RepID=UPI003A979A70
MKQHILILGAGFSGMWSALSAARLLDKNNRSDISISVVAPQAELRVRPRFYEPEVHTMKASLDELFAAVDVNFIKGSAQTIDTTNKRISYNDSQGQPNHVTYDRLILATGSSVARPALPGVDQFAFDVDQIEQAAKLESHIKALAKQPDSAARNTVVVAGGGFTGIETATEMPERLRAALGNDAKIRVIIVDRGQQIGAALGENISPIIAQATSELGVEWLLGTAVTGIDADGVTLSDGQRIETKTVVWTVGVRASSLTEQIAGERDNQGRLHVDSNLKVIGQGDVFATGDVAYATTDDQGNYALMTCQHAIALGRSAGNNAAASLLDVAPIPYRQEKYVTCLDLGQWGAVYTEGWDRQVKLVKDEGKQLKTQINTQWIYPPVADRATALAAADPLIPVVA